MNPMKNSDGFQSYESNEPLRIRILRNSFGNVLNQRDPKIYRVLASPGFYRAWLILQ